MHLLPPNNYLHEVPSMFFSFQGFFQLILGLCDFFLKEHFRKEGSQGFFYIPSIKEDIHCAVDLGFISSVPSGENFVCQIKGIANTTEVTAKHLNEITFETEKERIKYQRSLNNIREYEKANQPVKALWITAPSKTE